MTRVICLYRVSTKGQVEKDDIPMQRIECRRFIESKSWTLVNEYVEKGVSGFKVSATKRDAIVEIRQEAERGSFDVLLVYMFDRLGRRDDETPFLVEWFVKNGIEVWSTQEGQQKFETHVDKLLNYIRYWQASGESIKTSVRIRTKQQQMTEEGVWRGGTRPFGYKLIHNGRIGKKNRQLYDLVIDEQESAIVKYIFHRYCEMGMGIHVLANHLNEKYPMPHKIWAPQSIRSILKNPIYTGRIHFNDTIAPVNEMLRIISDEQFAFAARVMSERITRHARVNSTMITVDEDGQKTDTIVAEENEPHADNEETPSEQRTMTEMYGATLLSGILYCGHCDHKLVGTYHIKKRTNGDTYYRPVYRCYNGAVKAKHCDGQRTYSAAKVETAVLEIVRQYFQHFSSAIDNVWKEQARIQLKQGSTARLKLAQSNLAKLHAQLKKLKEEMVNVLMGDSVFDKETIKEMIAEKQKAVEVAEAYVAEIQSAKDDSENHLQQLMEQYRSIQDWAEVFDEASNDEKKMILSRIIQKITVNSKYEINIYFFLTLEGFRHEVEKIEGINVVDVLAEKEAV